ncbi:FkbM family methyltransferase [Acidithiobacillus sp.]|uniref:FkbM family methyltransferase n=1 Tax=Acidithiobacillus sp. TaxID=1872118 RepID=UPI003CFD3F33
MMKKKPHIVNRILSPLGVKVKRTLPGEYRPFSAAGKPTARRIGRFEILMYPSSQLFHIYGECPGYQAELGHIARAVVCGTPGARIIDVGANVGDTLAIIRSHCDAPVLAIEGDDASFELLARNTKIFPSVEALKAFLGEREEDISANIRQAGWNATLLPTGTSPGDGRGKVVRLDTLDRILSGRPERPDYRFLKIDAEGFDFRIIRGARVFLSEIHPVLLFEYNRGSSDPPGEDAIATLVDLAQMGYHDMLVWDAGGRFLLRADLSMTGLIRDLHGYIEGGMGLGYLDICLFHTTDHEVASRCADLGRSRRAHTPRPAHEGGS